MKQRTDTPTGIDPRARPRMATRGRSKAIVKSIIALLVRVPESTLILLVVTLVDDVDAVTTTVTARERVIGIAGQSKTEGGANAVVPESALDTAVRVIAEIIGGAHAHWNLSALDASVHIGARGRVVVIVEGHDVARVQLLLQELLLLLLERLDLRLESHLNASTRSVSRIIVDICAYMHVPARP